MIRPLNGNVILKKEIKENKTASGIVLSQKKEEEEFAHIVALSNDEEVKKLSLKVGDKVLFKNYSTTKVNYEDEEYQNYRHCSRSKAEELLKDATFLNKYLAIINPRQEK